MLNLGNENSSWEYTNKFEEKNNWDKWYYVFITYHFISKKTNEQKNPVEPIKYPFYYI